MRPQDEILWSYPEREAPGRALLLRHLGDLEPLPDPGGVSRLLRQEADDALAPSSLVAQLRVRSRSFEKRIRHLAPLDPPEFLDRGLAWEQTATPRAPTEEAELLTPWALEELDCLIPWLRSQAGNSGRSGRLAVLSLARLGTPAALSSLQGLPEETLPLPRRLQALALHGSEAARAQAEHLLLRLPEEEQAILLPLLGEFPEGPPTQPLLSALAGAPEQRRAGAHSLVGCPDAVLSGSLPGALGDPDPWVAAHALQTLGERAPANFLELLRTRFRQRPPAPLPALCMRTLSRVAPPGGEELALEGLASRDPETQALALEALLAYDLDPCAVLEHARPHLGSPHPRLAQAACLAAASVDPDEGSRAALGMLLGEVAETQLRGLHALAYIDAPGASERIREVLDASEALPLKEQALTSLGIRARRLPEGAFPLLLCLRDGSPEIRGRVARLLGDVHPLARTQAASGLGDALDGEDDDDVAREMLAGLQALGPHAGKALRPLGSLLESGSPLAFSAGSCLTWALPESDAAASLQERPHPFFRGLAVIRAWSLGREEIEGLAPVLERAGPEQRVEFLERIGELVEAAHAAGASPRMRGLARRLRLGLARDVPFPVPRSRRPDTSTLDALDWLDTPAEPRKPSRTERRPSRLPVAPRRQRRPRGRDGFRVPGAPLSPLPEAWKGASPQDLLRARLRAGPLPPPPSPGPSLLPLGLAALVLLGVGHLIRERPWERALGPVPGEVTSRRRPPASAPARPPKRLPGTRGAGTGGATSVPASPKSEWDAFIDALAVKAAVHPTSKCPVFEERWQQLREWIIRELDEGTSAFTYTELMQLRFRHLQGDESTHERLDDWLRKASEQLQERRIAAEEAGAGTG